MIGRRPVTLSRGAPGAYAAGVWVPAATAEIVISASVQPMSANELDAMPEGRRVTGGYKLYSESEIRIGDQLEIEGRDHEVVAVQPHQSGLLSHYKAMTAPVETNGA